MTLPKVPSAISSTTLYSPSLEGGKVSICLSFAMIELLSWRSAAGTVGGDGGDGDDDDNDVEEEDPDLLRH